MMKQFMRRHLPRALHPNTDNSFVLDGTHPTHPNLRKDPGPRLPFPERVRQTVGSVMVTRVHA
jgi:hypothetical protein